VSDAADEPADDRLFELAARQGETPLGRSAAARLLGRHQQRVYLWCRRRVHDHARALDLAEEVLLRAHRSMPEWNGRARFSSWLFAIAEAQLAESAGERPT
jgi:RNA polymerase sigma-70 factor (ECF subfamily)